MSRVPTRDEILAATDRLKTERVDVPEWGDGCFVIARELTSRQSDDIADLVKSKIRDGDAKLVAMATYNGSIKEDGSIVLGERIFSVKDAEAIAELGMAPIKRICQTILRLSGLLPDQVKITEKNSEAGPANDSAAV